MLFWSLKHSDLGFVSSFEFPDKQKIKNSKVCLVPACPGCYPRYRQAATGIRDTGHL